MKETKELYFEDVRPYVRNVKVMQIDNTIKHPKMKSYDNIMLYTCKGEGVVIVDDNKYVLKKGCVLLWKAALPYRHIPTETGVTYISINFDYSYDNADVISYPVYPDEVTVFKDEKIMENLRIINSPSLNNVAHLSEMQFVEERLWLLKSEHERKERYFSSKLSGLMFSVLSDIARCITDRNTIGENTTTVIDEIITYICEHYNEEINNGNIGEKFNFHPNYINSLMKAHTGYSLHQYLIMRRISRAINLLQDTNMQITEISNLVGFKNISHFSRFFKKTVGVSPRAFRKRSSI